MSDQIADILADTAEYLETHGWTRDQYQDIDGRACLVGAVIFSQNWQNRRTDHRELREGVFEALMRVIRRKWTLNGYPVAVSRWNDQHAKDINEVLDVIRKAEKIERAGYDPDA